MSHSATVRLIYVFLIWHSRKTYIKFWLHKQTDIINSLLAVVLSQESCAKRNICIKNPHLKQNYQYFIFM